MIDDPIVNEVRRIREEILASYNYDLKAMFEDAIRRQFLSGHKVVAFDRKTGMMVEVKPPKSLRRGKRKRNKA